MAYTDYIRQTPEGYIRVVNSADYDSIVSYTPLPDITVFVDDVVNLPNTVEATFKSGKVETMIIKWERVNVDTSTAGTQKIYGDIGNGAAAVLQNVIVNELTDLDILRQIRDANPTSQLPALWMDSEDPYTQWEGVTWRTIGIKKYVKYLSIYNDKQIYSLPNVNRLTYLQELLCFNNSISVLDISEMPTLSRISCDRNEMTQLKVENSPNLYDISCYQNKIKYLDLKGITRVALEAGNNLLESVIFYSPVITRLGLNSNKLTSIPTLISKSEIVYYTFVLNNFPTSELDRFRAMGFTDESKLLPQNP